MRYYKQKNKSTCGPVAILNALKWSGLPITGKDLDILKEICLYTPKRGTGVIQFDNVIDSCFYNYYLTPKLRDMENHLKSGRAIIALSVRKNKTLGHMFFISGVSKNGKMFEVVNLFSDTKAVVTISRKRLKTFLGTRRSRVWHIF